MRWISALRGLLVGDARVLARAAQARRLTPEAVLQRRFRREFRVPDGRASEYLVFGEVRGSNGGPVPVGLPVERMVGERGTHALSLGPSRSGKTRMALFVASQLSRMAIRPWVVDPKGDLARGRLRQVAAEAERVGRDAVADRVRVLHLFDPMQPPPLRLTAREEGVPTAVQAASLATALGEAAGAEILHRMGRILQYPAELAVETNQPLTAILDWLTRPASFAAAASRSPNERLRHFASDELPRENKESIRGLVARLERVLRLPSVRRAVEAPTCFSFREALERYEVILDASNPPVGEEAAVRMLCGPIFGRMTRAILNRRVTPETAPVLLFIDELPEVLGRFEAEGSVGRLVSLAGSRLANFYLILQDGRAQLGADLFHLLRTNCSIELVFRPSHRDAELVAHALPVPEGVERPAQVREALVRKLTRLKRREYLFWCKDGRVPAHFVTAPFVDLESLPDPTLLRERLLTGARSTTDGKVETPIAGVTDPAVALGPLLFTPSSDDRGAEADDAAFPALG